jgi:hypothetical protein
MKPRMKEKKEKGKKKRERTKEINRERWWTNRVNMTNTFERKKKKSQIHEQ